VRTGWSTSGHCGKYFALALLAAAIAAPACTKAVDAKRDPVTLRIGVASPKAGATLTGARGFVGNLLSESLLGIGWNGRPTSRIAFDDPVWSDDGLTLDIRLRKDVQFHDGTRVDSKLVKRRLEQVFKASNYVSYKSVVGVEAVGVEPGETDLVRIRLSRRESLLVADLTNSTIPHPTNADVGLGPFKLLSRQPKIRLAAFEHYYRARPGIDIVEVEEYEEQRTAWAALMRGELDAVYEITPGAIDIIEVDGQTGVRTYPFIRPYYIQLAFNVRHPILKNTTVRQALSYAVDRQAIIDLALNRQGIVSEGPIWPFHWAYSTAQKTYGHNAEAATLRLDAAGLRMKPAAVPGAMPSRLRFRCLTVAKESRFERMALVLQKQLYEIGVDMEIEAVPLSELVKRIDAGQFDAFLAERTSGRSLGWTYNTFHSTKMPGYTAADTVLERLRRTTSDGEVRTAVSDLQQVFYDHPPAIFIAWPKVARVVSTKLHVPEDAGPDVISNLWMWKPAEPNR
jgi:ABC-type transport system substrate-binding protein